MIFCSTSIYDYFYLVFIYMIIYSAVTHLLAESTRLSTGLFIEWGAKYDKVKR